MSRRSEPEQFDGLFQGGPHDSREDPWLNELSSSLGTDSRGTGRGLRDFFRPGIRHRTHSQDGSRAPSLTGHHRPPVRLSFATDSPTRSMVHPLSAMPRSEHGLQGGVHRARALIRIPRGDGIARFSRSGCATFAAPLLRASVGSTEAISNQSASVSSDRRAQDRHEVKGVTPYARAWDRT